MNRLEKDLNQSNTSQKQRYYLTQDGKIVDVPSPILDSNGESITKEILSNKDYHQQPNGGYYERNISSKFPRINLFEKAGLIFKKQKEDIKKQFDNDLLYEKKIEQGSKDKEIIDLKNKLNNVEGDNKSLKEVLKSVDSDLSNKLEELSLARQEGNEEKIKKIEMEIKDLKNKKNGIFPNEFGIKTLEIKRLGFQFYGTNTIDGKSVLTGPQLSFRRNIRSRKRLNKTIRKINSFKENSPKAIRYILEKTSLIKGGALFGKTFKRLKNRRGINDKNSLNSMLTKQITLFVDDLYKKLGDNNPSIQDKASIVAITNRFNRYKKDFLANSIKYKF